MKANKPRFIFLELGLTCSFQRFSFRVIYFFFLLILLKYFLHPIEPVLRALKARAVHEFEIICPLRTRSWLRHCLCIILNVFWMQDKFLWTKNFHFKCVLIKINIIKLFLHNSIFPFIIPTNSCKKNKITESCLLMQRFIAAIRKGRIFNFGGERMIKAEIVINYELSDRAIKQL